MRRLTLFLALLLPPFAGSQTVDIGAEGVSGPRKSIKVSLNEVVKVTLPSGQSALIQFTAMTDTTAEYRWKYRRSSDGQVESGTGRVEEKYERTPTTEPHHFEVKPLPGNEVTIRAGGILAQWSAGGEKVCYFYYDSKLAHAKVLKSSAFEGQP